MVEGAKCEELEKIIINNDDEKYFQVGVQLPHREKEELIYFLRKNIDVFAWSAYEAPRMDLNFNYHHLNVNPFVTPKKQPPWRSFKEHSDAVKEEMVKLKHVEAIKEVFYPEWLVNTVVVKKKNKKWRVCVDFTDLNKVCPQRSLLDISDRPVGGCNGWSSLYELFECLSKVPSDTISSGRPKED